MKSLYHSFIFIFFLFAGFMAKAQTVSHERCGAVSVAQKMNQSIPGYATQFDQWLEEFKSSNASRAAGYDSTLFVRVVVHVVYNTPQQNLDDSVILNQINILNRDFGRTNADTVNMRTDFNGVKSTNSKIVFFLAQTDPNGNPTTGITRTSTSTTTFFDLLNGGLAEGVKYTAEGGIDAWDTDRYLNIWVCNMAIPLLGPSILGYATPPDGLPNWDPGSTTGIVDGVVIQFQAFGDNNPNPLTALGTTFTVKGRTPVHEVGHYLGLRHIWGDENNCTGTDGMDDTPGAEDASAQDCDASKNTCVDNIQGQDLPDMIENYMDYSAEDCQNSFTKMQVDFMRWVLRTKRSNVHWTSLTSTVEVEQTPTLSIVPNPANDFIRVNAGLGVEATGEIIIRDVCGKQVVQQRLNKGEGMDVSDLKPGIYFVSLAMEGRQVALGKFAKATR
jgi:hypothetical protein